MAEAKLHHKKSHLRAAEAALIKARDAIVDQVSLAANTRQLLDASLQKKGRDFLTHGLDHVHVEGPVVWAYVSKLCGAVITTVRQQHAYDCRDIADWMIFRAHVSKHCDVAAPMVRQPNEDNH